MTEDGCQSRLLLVETHCLHFLSANAPGRGDTLQQDGDFTLGDDELPPFEDLVQWHKMQVTVLDMVKTATETMKESHSHFRAKHDRKTEVLKHSSRTRNISENVLDSLDQIVHSPSLEQDQELPWLASSRDQGQNVDSEDDLESFSGDDQVVSQDDVEIKSEDDWDDAKVKLEDD